jgi:hypothetical protein
MWLPGAQPFQAQRGHWRVSRVGRPNFDRDPSSYALFLHRGVHFSTRDQPREPAPNPTLATVGAFRVVSSRDLRNQHDRPLDPRSGGIADHRATDLR